MKLQLAATALCALLAIPPALAQQGQAPSTTPSRASPEPTSNPPADPFKDGGRPESHGGTVHAPQVGSSVTSSAQSLSPEIRQTVESLAENTVTAQQYGNLAADRHASEAAHELGDRMFVTNSRINRALTAAVPGLRASEQMPADQRATFDSLARQADEKQFGVSLAQWVAQNYPETISALQRLSQESGFEELTSSALPELKAQLSEAQRILQTASSGTNGQPLATGTVGKPGAKKLPD
ncbi:DUF4142 domain-containing protein [Microvirga massiliensis]|uniref:DUF4142 domain-containing protein n=1 Tax=Microvirga massiliensis TaxID=1033741 RepID=UPI00062B44EC|nr:DUF4142 domain-containing protein [Microvirga massiliensis]